MCILKNISRWQMSVEHLCLILPLSDGTDFQIVRRLQQGSHHAAKTLNLPSSLPSPPPQLPHQPPSAPAWHASRLFTFHNVVWSSRRRRWRQTRLTTDLIATDTQRGGQPSVTRARRPSTEQRDPTPRPQAPLPPTPKGPLAPSNAATEAHRGSLTGTKWTATYPP